MLKMGKGKVVEFGGQNYDQLRKDCLSNNEAFIDPLFLPTNASLSHSGAKSLHDSNIEWKRITEISEPSSKFFDEHATFRGMDPGLIGNGWFITAASVICSQEKYWTHAIPDPEKQEGAGKLTGIYHFRFWRFGHWVDVCVDDHLPTVEGKQVCSHSLREDEFWVGLYEKAYAKLCGSYGVMDREGNLLDALVDFTSGFSEHVYLRGFGDCAMTKLNCFKEIVTRTISEKGVVCASIRKSDKEDISFGLVKGHEYIVTGMTEIHPDSAGHHSIFNCNSCGEKIVLVRLRCPWGNWDYNGPFSEGSLEWTRLQDKEKHRMGLVFEENSEFWMPIEECAATFDSLSVCHVATVHSIFSSPHDTWMETIILGAWTRPNHAGGCGYSGYNNNDEYTFLHNPQYLFDIHHPESEMLIQLMHEPKEGQNHAPGSHPIRIGFNILKVEENRFTRLHRPIPSLVTSGYERSRSVLWRGYLRKGRYILIPTTYEPNIPAEFLIRVHSDTEEKVKFVELVNDRPYFGLNWNPLSTHPMIVTQITVKGAKGLTGCENTYCQIKVEGETLKSEVIRNSQDPKWDLRGIFYRKDACKPITVEVWESRPQHSDKFVGCAILSGESDNRLVSVKKSLVGNGDTREERHPGEIMIFIATYDELDAI